MFSLHGFHHVHMVATASAWVPYDLETCAIVLFSFAFRLLNISSRVWLLETLHYSEFFSSIIVSDSLITTHTHQQPPPKASFQPPPKYEAPPPQYSLPQNVPPPINSPPAPGTQAVSF